MHACIHACIPRYIHMYVCVYAFMYVCNAAALLVIGGYLMRFFPYSSRDQKNDRLK